MKTDPIAVGSWDQNPVGSICVEDLGAQGLKRFLKPRLQDPSRSRHSIQRHQSTQSPDLLLLLVLRSQWDHGCRKLCPTAWTNIWQQ